MNLKIEFFYEITYREISCEIHPYGYNLFYTVQCENSINQVSFEKYSVKSFYSKTLVLISRNFNLEINKMC